MHAQLPVAAAELRSATVPAYCAPYEYHWLRACSSRAGAVTVVVMGNDHATLPSCSRCNAEPRPSDQG